jgi:hypothetical protein
MNIASVVPSFLVGLSIMGYITFGKIAGRVSSSHLKSNVAGGLATLCAVSTFISLLGIAESIG